jgi:hypothetical protein
MSDAVLQDANVEVHEEADGQRGAYASAGMKRAATVARLAPLLAAAAIVHACSNGSSSGGGDTAAPPGTRPDGGDAGASPDATTAPDGDVTHDAGTDGDASPSDGGLPVGSYSTTFPATENPLAERGVWRNGQTDGLDWRDVRTTPGLAFGTQPGTGAPPYDDSTALLAGTWSPDHTAQATVRIVTPSAVGQREVELRLRSTITAHACAGYEILCNVVTNPSYGIQIVRWNGALNSYTYLGNTPALHCVDGDVLKATIQGSPPTITVWLNGTMKLQATDANPSPPTTGSPGIGFWNEGATSAEYGFSAFSAHDGT